MPKIQEVKPPSMPVDILNPQAPSAFPLPKCITTLQPDGGVQVCFLMEPEVAHRYRRRAGNMSLEEYIWENVLKRAVVDHVY